MSNLEHVTNLVKKSGRPTVAGVLSTVIAGQLAAGDSVDTIARNYNLHQSGVEDAVRYELRRRAARLPEELSMEQFIRIAGKPATWGKR